MCRIDYGKWGREAQGIYCIKKRIDKLKKVCYIIVRIKQYKMNVLEVTGREEEYE